MAKKPDLFLTIGSIVLWPSMKNVRGRVLAIDRVPFPAEPVAWICRQDQDGGYHYHTAKLTDLKMVKMVG
jgi:hypothetical protein